jgi:hypothetical protein
MPKKKIKDMTTEEKRKYCESKSCSKCPCGIWPCDVKQYTICALDEAEFDEDCANYEIEVEK